METRALPPFMRTPPIFGAGASSGAFVSPSGLNSKA
jgi:hypothetical protein